jgi:hypothetical protein
MPVMELEEARRRREHPVSTPVDPTPEPGMTRISPEQEWVVEIRLELDTYLEQLRSMRSKDPTDVFMTLSAITARLCELRVLCMRTESRRTAALRTREIDPMIEECERQFRFHSRIQAARQMEWDQTRNLT